MATESEHRQQAEQNGAFLATIDQERFPEWVVTVAFYKAVHLIEMVFAHDSRKPGGSHGRRNQVLKRHYPDIWKQYRPLYTFSRMARYWCVPVTREYVTYVLRRLGRVENLVTEHMSR
jgi:hypothetical protein